MSFWEGLLRFVLGGTLVLIVSLAARYGKSSLAGIIALFPAITVISFYFLSLASDKKAVLAAIKSSIFSLPAVLVFLIILYITYSKTGIIKSLALSILAWIITAIVIWYLRK